MFFGSGPVHISPKPCRASQGRFTPPGNLLMILQIFTKIFFILMSVGTTEYLSRSFYVIFNFYFVRARWHKPLSNRVFDFIGLFRPHIIFQALDPLQPLAFSYPRSSALSASTRFRSTLQRDIPRIFLDISTAYCDRPFLSRFSKTRPEPWKLCSSQALSTLRKSCFRSQNTSPGAETESQWHFTLSCHRQKQRR